MNKKDIIFALIIALFLAILISPFASSWPDGLEKVAEDKGFLQEAVVPTLASPIPDYAWPGVKNKILATSLAGVTGTLIVFIIGYGLAVLLKKRSIK